MPKGNEGNSPSVRIDIESGSVPGVDTPEVRSSSGGSGTSGPLILGVLVLAVIGASLFLLRPAENAAADGTIREAPTTTTVEVVEEPDEGPQEEAQEAPELLFPDQEFRQPISISAPELPDSIVAVDNGFLGLVRGVSLAPTILRSVDGVDWRLVETSADTGGFERDWESLTNPEGQLQIQATTVANEFFTDVFQSADGLDWRQVAEIGSLGGPALPQLPLVVREDGYLAFGFGGAEVLDRFLRDHTTLSVEENGACFIVVSRSTDPSRVVDLVVTDCDSTDEDQLLEASVIASDFSDEEILACGQVLASAGPSGALVDQEFGLGGGSGARTIVDFVVGRDVVPLLGGDIAVIDAGFTVLQQVELCDGIADLRRGSVPSVLHVNQETDEVSRWPLPGDPVQGDPKVGEAAILGRVQGDADAVTLLVGYNGSLWRLDISTGEWTPILRRFEPDPAGINPFGEFGTQVVLSESADLVYSITDGMLFVFRIDPITAGSFTAFDITAAAQTFEASRILFADDEALFVQTNDDVVRLAVPIR